VQPGGEKERKLKGGEGEGLTPFAEARYEKKKTGERSRQPSREKKRAPETKEKGGLNGGKCVRYTDART